MATNFVPVSFQTHGTKLFLASDNCAFAATDNLAPLIAHELPKAMMLLPIAFTESDGKYELKAMQGLEQGRNVLVDVNGKWRGRYKPEIYRTYPFISVPTDSGEYALCIDENSGLLHDEAENGIALFDEDGQPSEAINKLLESLNIYNAKREKTNSICDLLGELSLIKPWEIHVEKDGMPFNIQGMFCIDEKAINELEPDKLGELRDSGALLIAYAQILSMIHVNQLWTLSQGAKDLYGVERDSELSFAGLSDTDILNFDNL